MSAFPFPCRVGLRFAHNGITSLYKYLAMIMQEKIVMKKQIPNSSNSFLFRKSYIHSKILTDYPQNPWGFITVPIPIPMGISMGIPIPTAALFRDARQHQFNFKRMLSRPNVMHSYGGLLEPVGSKLTLLKNYARC